MGSCEDRSYVLQQNNYTRVQWRQNSCAECGEDGKWASRIVYAHNVCPHSTHTHTHIWRIAKLTDQTHKHWMQNPSIGQQLSQQSQHHTPLMELHYSNSCQQFLAYIYSTHVLTSNWFLGWLTASSAFIYSFVYKPTCTTLGLTCPRNQMNRVSGVNSTSPWGACPGVLSDTPTKCVTQCANVPFLKRSPDTMQTMH